MEILQWLGNLNPTTGSQLSRSSQRELVKDETGVVDAGLAGCARRACPVGMRARFQSIAITARHTTKVGNTRSQWPNRKEGAAEGGIGDWDEVVTR